MKDYIKEIQTIMRELSEIKPSPHQDLLQTAIQVQRNRILKTALVLSDSDAYPGALEKIAMELEGSGNKLSSIRNYLHDIDSNVNSIDTNVSTLGE